VAFGYINVKSKFSLRKHNETILLKGYYPDIWWWLIHSKARKEGMFPGKYKNNLPG